jgi:hypothetical protein
LKRANIDLSKRWINWLESTYLFLLFNNLPCLSNSIIIFLFWLIRAGQLKPDEIERIVAVINAPTEFQIPSWFLNRQKDFTSGETKQHVSNGLSAALRDDLTRLKKIR